MKASRWEDRWTEPIPFQRPWVIIPTFDPPSDLPTHIAELGSVSQIIVVDDGTCTSQGTNVLQALEAAGVEVIYNAENSGIAYSLNRGIALALSQSCEYVLTLDQDSHMSRGSLLDLTAALDRSPTHIAAIGPGSVTGVHYRPRRQSPAVGVAELREVAELIQSGMIVRTGVLKRVGLFREDLFIDLVDSEFSLRLRRAGYVLCIAPEVDLVHRLGTGGRTLRLGPFHPSTSGHSPTRWYYRTRNLILVIHQYARFDKLWAARAVRRFSVALLSSLLLEGNRAERLHAVQLGVKDAVTGRRGKMSSEVWAKVQ